LIEDAMQELVEERGTWAGRGGSQEPKERDGPEPARASVVRPALATSPLVCQLVGFDQRGRPLVEMPGPSGRLCAARSTVRLPKRCGCEVLVLLEEGDRRRPIVIGVLQPESPEACEDAGAVNVSVDGKALELVANRELVMRCGDASITLTAAGKVLIRGRYVVSRSSGANKIKGAVVDIN
jgi:hypothetical protein